MSDTSVSISAPYLRRNRSGRVSSPMRLMGPARSRPFCVALQKARAKWGETSSLRQTRPKLQGEKKCLCDW